MKNAPIGPTKPEAGVMATRPATAPEQMPMHGRLAAHHPFDQHPGEAGRRGGDVRDRHGHAGLHAGGDGGAGVEAEPADPQQRGADQGETMLWAGPVSLRLPSIRRPSARRCRN